MIRLYDYGNSGNCYKVRLQGRRWSGPTAGEGGFSLDAYPRVNAWLDRARDQRGHIRITDQVGTLVSWP